MKILDLIRFNPDWETIIQGAPWFIKTSWDGDYVLLKYNQLASDFDISLVRECRGCIFYLPNKNHAWADIVCYPFEKFGNYGESYVPEIDWRTASVQEKVDGSLIKLWNHKGEWHVSTNGTIDARLAPTSVEGVSFYDVFMRALEKNGNPSHFFESLDVTLTYMFELVSPETRVTIEYPEAAIYYLGARKMTTFEEIGAPWLPAGDAFQYYINLPKIYPLQTLEDCIMAVNAMGADEEGFVICDANFNRVKLKSPEWLIASKIRNNNSITVKRVIEAMRAGYLDDLFAYAPDYRNFINQVIAAHKYIAVACRNYYQEVLIYEMLHPELKFHELVNKVPAEFRDYCFRKHAGKVEDGFDYVDRILTISRLVEWIRSIIKDC